MAKKKKRQKPYKLKTNKAAAKRLKVTASGKIMRRQAGIGHLNAKLSGKQRRQQRKYVQVSKHDARKLKKLMPYR